MEAGNRKDSEVYCCETVAQVIPKEDDRRSVISVAASSMTTVRPNLHVTLYLALAFLAWPSVSLGGLFGPSDYDECILQSMKGVTSDLAARAIMRSCREKFPVKRPSDAELPAQARASVTGRAGLKYGSFTGHIYNGSSDYTITQVTIVLMPKNKKGDIDLFGDAKEYNVDVTVSPLTNGFFSVSVDSAIGDEVSWNITKARGYKTR